MNENHRRKSTSAGAEILGALAEFRDALRDGGPIEERLTVRTVSLDLKPRTYGAAEVLKVRKALNLSQPLFARFLGVGVKTVRAWEQGLRQPSAMASRFLDEISFNPEYWRGRLRERIRDDSTQPA